MSEVRDERVLEAVAGRRTVIDDAIPEELPGRAPERLWEAARHLLDAGGKRLRPGVVMLAGEALVDVPAGESPAAIDYRAFPTLDGDEVDLLRAAIAVETVHTFTLIHDDIIDDDPLRRGVDAVHETYDEETAIIAGDTLYATAFELLSQTGATPENEIAAVRRLADACTRLCEGQALDVSFETRTDVTSEEYLDMVDRKTAVLYGASAAIPAVLVGADERTVEELQAFGREVGQAFQIQDDVLDLTVPSEKLGKQRGSDLVENKQTIITVHAREQGVDVDGLVDADDPTAVTEAEIDAAVAELEAAGSIDYASEMAQDLVETGKDRLEVLPENESRELLEGIADYLIERGY